MLARLMLESTRFYDRSGTKMKKKLSMVILLGGLSALSAGAFATATKRVVKPLVASPKARKVRVQGVKKSKKSTPVSSHNSLYSALFHGKARLSFRGRYEHVKQDNALRNAHAQTLLTLLGYQTGNYKGFSAFARLEGVTRLGPRTYNSGAGTSPTRTKYSVVADPSVMLVNEAYLAFNRFYKTRFRLGRQVIALDNQRFVGAVAFRQNMQTFDALSVQNTYFHGLKLFYAYIDYVNRIFGPGASNHQGRQKNSTNLFNASYTPWQYGTFTPYLYLIHNKRDAAFSTKTYGLRFAGKAAFKYATVLYTLEYAHQNNAYNNKTGYSAYYSHIGFGAQHWGVTLRADQERLSGNKNEAGKAFRTPLATLHKFQGWDDLFLTTPSAGIVDSYLTLKATIKPLHHLMFTAMAHNFSAEAGSQHYGKEVDLMLGKTWCKRLTTSIAYGDYYGARAPYVDTQKIWLTFAAHFEK
jgi:hypothetical protein